MGNRALHIERVAGHIYSQLLRNGPVASCDGLDECELEAANYPKEFWAQFGARIKNLLRTMGPEARGRILACGVSATMQDRVPYGELDDKPIDTTDWGNELLTHLAAMVIAANIVDRLRADAERNRREEAGDKHQSGGEGGDLVEWFKRNPLLD